MTKRQSLKLLGEILLDRANFNVMTKYIANEANLKMMMNLLRDKSKNIQFEAFHVFKVGSPFFFFLVEAYSKSPHFPGVRRKSQKTTTNWDYSTEEQGKVVEFFENFPQWQRGCACSFLISGPGYIIIIHRRTHFPFLISSCLLFFKKKTSVSSWISLVDEQFSDEKQFLIVQIQNL